MILRSNKSNKLEVCQCLNRPKIGHKMKGMNHMIQKIFQILSNKNNKSKVCQCLNRPKIGHKMKEMNYMIQKIFQENTDTTDDMKRILMMSFGSKWKESKHEAKTIRYDPYNTDIEHLSSLSRQS